MVISKTELFDEVLQDQASLFKALAHPARLQILLFLAKSKNCISGDISDELPLSRTTVNQHLKELKEAGLIQGEINPPYIKYCINKTGWSEAKELLGTFFNRK